MQVLMKSYHFGPCVTSRMSTNFLVLLFFGMTVQANIYIFDDDYMRFKIDEFADKELPFAVPIPKYGLQGAIVSAEPSDACSTLSGPPKGNYSLYWFVLIAGNFCDYETKVKNAELAGYSAAVIYNVNEIPRRPIHKGFTAVNISAVTIRTGSGLIIKANYLFSIDTRFNVLIYPNNSFDISTFFLLFLTGGFGFIIFTILILKFVHQMRSLRHSRLCSHHLNQLQVSTYQKGDPYETCAICLEDYKSNDSLRILPCSHAYHVKCIDPWLTNNRRTCPICKQKIALSAEFSSDVESGETSPLLNNATRSVTPARYTSTANVSDSIAI